MYQIKTSNEFGRGLYATRLIYSGELICVCEVLPLSPADTRAVNATDLKFYTFKYSEATDCLVLGDGELFNHAFPANVSYALEYFKEPHLQGRDRMYFRATRDIEAGEQLFIDYSADDEETRASDYRTNLL